MLRIIDIGLVVCFAGTVSVAGQRVKGWNNVKFEAHNRHGCHSGGLEESPQENIRF